MWYHSDHVLLLCTKMVKGFQGLMYKHHVSCARSSVVFLSLCYYFTRNPQGDSNWVGHLHFLDLIFSTVKWGDWAWWSLKYFPMLTFCDPNELTTSAKWLLSHKYSFYCSNVALQNTSFSYLEWPFSPPIQITHIIHSPPRLQPVLKTPLGHQEWDRSFCLKAYHMDDIVIHAL